MIPQCIDMGVGLLPWSPLARGALARPADASTGTVRGASDHLIGTLVEDTNRTIIDAVGEVADELGMPRASVALAWVLQRDGVTAPIVGTSRLDHLTDALTALTVQLPPDGVAKLETGYSPRSVLL